MSVAAPIAVIALCLLASTAIVISRFYVRIHSANKFDAGDYTIVLALVLQISLVAVGIVLLTAPPSELVYINKVFYAGTFLYFGDLWVVKISINLFHIKLTSRLGLINTIAKGSLYFTCLTGIIVLLLQIFGCWPISRRYTSVGVQGCDDIQNSTIFWICAAFNFTTDIILIILPYPALLRISERRIRVVICVVFTLAGSILIMTTIRAALISAAPVNSNVVILVLSNLECGVCVAISAVPGISHFFTTKYLSNGSSSGWRRTNDPANAGSKSYQTNSLRPGRGAVGLASLSAKTTRSAGISEFGRKRAIGDSETESQRGLESSNVEAGTWISTGSSRSPSLEGKRDEEEGVELGSKQIVKKTTIQISSTKNMEL